MSDIVLPIELLPADGRFGCGPAKIRDQQIANLIAVQNLLGTSHRQAPIKNLVADIQSKLLELFRAPEGYEIILGNGGATAFWDASAYSLIQSRSQNLVFGEFGAKFAKAASAPHLTAPDVISVDPGKSAKAIAKPGIDVYAWTHNETSTGVAAPVSRVQGDADALTVIDGTSAAGGIDFSAAETDVYYFSPQKNFGSDGGLWLAMISPKAADRIETIAKQDRYIPEFLSLKVALDNSRQHQTLNTPAIATLVLLHSQLEWMLSLGGLSAVADRTSKSSALLYDWADQASYASPFVQDVSDRSPVVVTIDFSAELDAALVAKVLRANGIVDVDPYRKLGRNQLRVATFAAIEKADVEKLIAAIEFVVAKIS